MVADQAVRPAVTRSGRNSIPLCPVVRKAEVQCTNLTGDILWGRLESKSSRFCYCNVMTVGFQSESTRLISVAHGTVIDPPSPHLAVTVMTGKIVAVQPRIWHRCSLRCACTSICCLVHILAQRVIAAARLLGSTTFTQPNCQRLI